MMFIIKLQALIKKKKENNINVENFEENDLSSGANILNNLNSKFDEQKQKNEKESKNIKNNIVLSNNFEEKIETNIQNENTENNFEEKNIDKKENENNKINLKEQNYNLKEEKNIIDKDKIFDNKKELIKIKDNQTTYYGILGILGLFCLKSLFSSNSIFSIDTFLNLFILGIISFVFYKTQLQ